MILFGKNQLGYGIQKEDGSTIPVLYQGRTVSDSYPGDGWRPTAAVLGDESDGVAYVLYWKNDVNGA